jgi:sugar phosphate isomerase/epimerase
MKIGMMNNPSQPVLEEAEFCIRSGFDFLDLTIEGPAAMDVDVMRLHSLLRDSGLFLVGHTDPCLPHAYPIPEVRDACRKELERCARIFSRLGATVMNIHPCYAAPPAMRNQLIGWNIESLIDVVEIARSYGLTVVLENYTAPFDRVAVFQRILQEVPGLQLHLDFGHTHFGTDSYERFCTDLGGQIRHVHFSDNRGRSDDHAPLGVGSINWKQAVECLQAAGYDGTITLEVFCGDGSVRYPYLDNSRKLVLSHWKEG